MQFQFDFHFFLASIYVAIKIHTPIPRPRQTINILHIQIEKKSHHVFIFMSLRFSRSFSLILILNLNYLCARDWPQEDFFTIFMISNELYSNSTRYCLTYMVVGCDANKQFRKITSFVCLKVLLLSMVCIFSFKERAIWCFLLWSQFRFKLCFINKANSELCH